MTVLELSRVQVEWGERQIGPLSAAYDARLLLLFGDFEWLFALLLGEVAPLSGSVRCFDEDARRAVVAGRIGVSPAPVQRAPTWSVGQWLELNAELLGQSSRAAKQNTRRLLEELGLSALEGRRVCDLNGAESFAAHAAFAAVGSPHLMLLGAPLLLPETRDYELSILSRLLERASVALVTRRRDPDLWELADVLAYCDGSGRTELPAKLLAPPSEHYRVRTFDDPAELSRALVARGATTEEHAPRCLHVVLPKGSGAALIVQTALDAHVALAELVSLAEAR